MLVFNIQLRSNKASIKNRLSAALAVLLLSNVGTKK
ncbi:hypothetical protein B6N60_02791 [Richelia sinica FACHB-800]|uniref:Uncharacterized protein n=1 Tax=Richelia sinica FACHB-800 TaxID=1357546 RepID=A0A975Y5C9_9NOST|nr:hypothetical protein B6N60_02791 [Richelia sinica FACHB-800]